MNENIIVSEAEWEWLQALLAEPTRDCPKLTALMQAPSPFAE